MITSEKHKHPLTSKIPLHIWRTVFNHKFDETTLQVENKDFNTIHRTDLPEHDMQALIMLILSYPDISLSRILNFLQLDLSSDTVLELCMDMGLTTDRVDILQYLDEQAPNQLSILLPSNNYSLFYRACENNSVRSLQWLNQKELIPLSDLVKRDNFEMLQTAARRDSVLVLDWFKQTIPPEEFHQIVINSARDILCNSGYLKISTLQWYKQELPAETFTSFLPNLLSHSSSIPIFKWLLEPISKEALPSIIEKSIKYPVFNLECIAWFADQIPKNQWVGVLRSINYSCFDKVSFNDFKWILNYTPDEMTYLLKDSGKTFSFSSDTCLDFIASIREHLTEAEFNAFIEKNATAIFKCAMTDHLEKGQNLEILKLLKKNNPKLLKHLLQDNNYDCIHDHKFSSSKNALEILLWIMTELPDELIPMIEASQKHTSSVLHTIQNVSFFKALKQRLPQKYFDRFLEQNQRALFNRACDLDNQELLEWMVEQQLPLANMIREGNYLAMRESVKKGGMRLIQWLMQYISEDDPKVVFLDSRVLHHAIHNTDWDLVQYIQEHVKIDTPQWAKIWADVLTEEFYLGKLEIWDQIKEKIAPEQWLDLLRADNYRNFDRVFHSNSDRVTWFLEQFPNEEHEPMLRSLSSNTLYELCGYVQRTSEYASSDRVKRLRWAMHYPNHFAYIEYHNFPEVVNPFVRSTLYALYYERDAQRLQNPNGVFDITDPQRAQLCFYILRNIIRRKDPTLDESLHFLINIPSVKALLHQAITPGESNELLRLAMSVNNVNASTVLLNIPAVRELAAANHYYRQEQTHGVDLRDLARNRESSMTALTQGEASRLDAVIKRYLPEIQRLGGKTHVMEELKKHLTERYVKKPAEIKKGSRTIALPLDFDAFIALKRTEKLTDDEWEAACQAYYKHPDHTAWRYLSKPNRWMHKNANFVYVSDDRTERWSTFEEYTDMISLFYLAAMDKEMPSKDYREQATPEKIVETRFALFINELALIGRAHNWDKVRQRDGKTEEYDDMEGDRPSCNIGVKRRLFQSVVGHPLLNILTEEQIDAEIRQFIVGHFQSVLQTVDTHQVQDILGELYSATDDDEKKEIPDIGTLARFNLSDAQQQGFIKELSKTYGKQFNDNPMFKIQIQNRFRLDSSTFESQYHLTKLAMLFDCYSYLVNKHAAETKNDTSDTSAHEPSTPLDTQKKIDVEETQPETPLPLTILDLSTYTKRYNKQVRCLLKIQDELHQKDSSYKQERDIVDNLCSTLQRHSTFFDNKTTLTKEQIIEFKTQITDAFETAQTAFNASNHPDLWFQVHPILRAILGVIAALLVIPALAVSLGTEKGYIHTFFGKSHREQVEASKSRVQEDLDLVAPKKT